MTAPRPGSTIDRAVLACICPAQESRACIAAPQSGAGDAAVSVREVTERA